ncbi:hypothetical protein JCM10213_005693 [Rhodosporidiobolus nylandii]
MPPSTNPLHLFLCTVEPAQSYKQKLRFCHPPFSSGSWRLECDYDLSAARLGRPLPVRLAWNGCEKTARWRSARLRANLADGKTVDDSLPLDQKGRFPPTRNGAVELKVRRQLKAFDVYIELEVEDGEGSSPGRCLAFIDGRAQLDLRLTFPPSSRTLSTSSALLSEASPWWKTLLATSGFMERGYSPRARLSSFDDSDAEDDGEEDGVVKQPQLRTPPPSPPLSPQLGPLPPFASPSIRTVPITGTSYHTYRSFLAYLLTGQLTIAPLTSTFLPPTSSASPSARLAQAQHRRQASLAASAALQPTVPRPVSPKALFRLAHFLDAPSAQARALSALREELTPENVMYELLGLPGGGPPLGEVYEEVWQAEVEFARERWEEVKETEGVREVRERMKTEGAGEYELKTMWALLGVGDSGE